jgi:hypothetical protein
MDHCKGAADRLDRSRRQLREHVVDVSDPASPRRVGTYNTSGFARRVAVSGYHAYVAAGESLQVIDVSDPANQQLVGSTWANALEVAVSALYAYLVDCDGLHIIDVSDPANPQRVGGNTGFSARGVVATEDYVFVSADQGLVILHQFTPLSGSALSFGPVQVRQNGVDLLLQGLPGLRVEIERSSDGTHWQSWTSGLLGTGPLELTDPEVNPWRFYRAQAR